MNESSLRSLRIKHIAKALALLALALALAGVSSTTRAQTVPVTSPPLVPAADLVAFVDQWMADAMAKNHVVGAAVSIVQNGQVVLKKGYGFSNLAERTPVDPDRTVFRVGSITKTMTWVLTMKEVEAGRMDLERPLNDYLPDYLKVPSDGQKNPILLRNMMEHSSGIKELPTAPLIVHEASQIRPRPVYLVAERPHRVAEPGAEVSYCTYCVALTAAAVEQVHGKRFEDLLESDFAGPLGMRDTSIREIRPERVDLPAPMPAERAARMSKAYAWENDKVVEQPYPFLGQIAPGGAASTTANDMTHYMTMLLADGKWKGKTFLKPETVAEFRTVPKISSPGTVDWAHGFQLYALPGGWRGFGHWGGANPYNAKMVLVPDLKLGVFISTNSLGGFEIIHGLSEAILTRFYPQSSTTKAD